MLVSAIQQHAITEGVTTLFLLTTTSADYFVKGGYRRVDRADVPADIQGTQQFAGLCPASAVVMVKELERTRAPSPT
jgi:N-acetylglutamate synthase-like GNAT family acetyltransferase